jgi:hypothetical protein
VAVVDRLLSAGCLLGNSSAHLSDFAPMARISIITGAFYNTSRPRSSHHVPRRAAQLSPYEARVPSWPRMSDAHRRLGGKSLTPLAEIAIGDCSWFIRTKAARSTAPWPKGTARWTSRTHRPELRCRKRPGARYFLERSTAKRHRDSGRSQGGRFRYFKSCDARRERRPRLRRLGDLLGGWYTPLAVALGAVAWLISGEASRFLAVLVVATPCPLLISIPVVILGSVSLAAQRGIVIRNPAVLEQIPNCRTMIFDKTGTLTYGEPRLTDVVVASGFNVEEVLRWGATVERYSKHPLARPSQRAALRRKRSISANGPVTDRAARSPDADRA